MCIVVDNSEGMSEKHLETQAICFLESDGVYLTQRCVCPMDVPGADWKSVETGM